MMSLWNEGSYWGRLFLCQPMFESDGSSDDADDDDDDGNDDDDERVCDDTPALLTS